MDLILWRHADAEDGFDDDKRKLTAKGRKQAARMAHWLRERLPEDYLLLASPAVRAQETAAALADRFTTSSEIGLSASPESILHAAQWPRSTRPTIVVGHQPTLGMTAARLLAGEAQEWGVRKGAIIWIVRKGSDTALRAALSPELI